MQPFEIVHRKLIKTPDGLRPAPDGRPADMRTWTGFVALIPRDPASVKKQVEAVRISFDADVMPVEGGTWVCAGYSDLERIVRALREMAR